MDRNKINIVSFDVPYPANYGGVIDIYYKIGALKECGYEIILHCYHYGRKPAKELEEICSEVYYYKRHTGIRYMFSHLPYIVVTRKDPLLLMNLVKNDYPVLFEGLHSCSYIGHKELSNRRSIVRMHNIEHEYYSELSRASGNPVKKLYFFIESLKLRGFEKIIKKADGIAAISEPDKNYLETIHHRVRLVPAFHAMTDVESMEGKGTFFLYHGKLSVEENEKAAIFLIDRVFSSIDTPLIIAGQLPSKKLIEKAKKLSNIKVIADPDDSAMKDLIRKAHCCILPTFQSTGLKLKLLVSLFQGKHVLVNPPMVDNTGMEMLCEIARNENEFREKVIRINDKDFTKENIADRKAVLKKFNTIDAAKILIKLFNE